MHYLLDTSIVSDLVRNPGGRVTVLAMKRGSPRHTVRLEAVQSVLPMLPFEMPADVAYGRIRTELERAGRPVGGNDMLIAALALGYIVVTDNERQFARIGGLPIENWLR